MKLDPISREQAFSQNFKRFYTGRPCKHGHDAQRFVSTGGCVACNNRRSKLFANIKAAATGGFFYDLHPDDYAAARAYCQALDLARGRVPEVPRGAERAAEHHEIIERREQLLAQYAPQPAAPREIKP